MLRPIDRVVIATSVLYPRRRTAAAITLLLLAVLLAATEHGARRALAAAASADMSLLDLALPQPVLATAEDLPSVADSDRAASRRGCRASPFR